MIDLPMPTACSTDDGCITCGDVAVVLTVVDATGSDAPCDALCRDELDRTETVATELVGAVTPGDRLLVHAGVALERLPNPEGEDR
jgi:hypothetical protein